VLAPKVNATSDDFQTCKIAYRTCAMDNRLIVRPKKSERPKILMVQNSGRAEIFMANLRQIPSIFRADDSGASPQKKSSPRSSAR
jgi:hypothetical protein